MILFCFTEIYLNARIAIQRLFSFVLSKASTRKARRRTAGRLFDSFMVNERVAKCLMGESSGRKRQVDSKAQYYMALPLFLYCVSFYYIYYFYCIGHFDDASTRDRETRARHPNLILFYLSKDPFELSERDERSATAEYYNVNSYLTILKDGPTRERRSVSMERSDAKSERSRVRENDDKDLRATVGGRSESARIPRDFIYMHICKLVRTMYELERESEIKNSAKDRARESMKARVTDSACGGRRRVAAGLAERPVVGVPPTGHYKTLAQRALEVFPSRDFVVRKPYSYIRQLTCTRVKVYHGCTATKRAVRES